MLTGVPWDVALTLEAKDLTGSNKKKWTRVVTSHISRRLQGTRDGRRKAARHVRLRGNSSEGE